MLVRRGGTGTGWLEWGWLCGGSVEVRRSDRVGHSVQVKYHISLKKFKTVILTG